MSQQIHTVEMGETITDVVLKTTGDLRNWEKILNANSFDSWTPELIPGSDIKIPEDCILQENIIRQLNALSICNNKPVDFEEQVNSIIDMIDKNKLFEDSEIFDFEDSNQYQFEN